jgi:pyridoxamine 5'-phosphate oxidase
MQMNDIIEFANQNPVTWLATVEDSKPHVRGMLMWFADETGFYFHTASIKALSEQIEKNPNVEAAFHNPGGGMGESRQLRVEGIVEIVNDEALQDKLYKDRPWLLVNKKNMPDTEVRIFRIVHGSAYIWHLGINGREKDEPRIVF